MSDYVVENKNVSKSEKNTASARSWTLPIMLVAVAVINLVLTTIF